MHFSSASLLSVLVAVAAAKPVPETHVIHEKRELQGRFTERWVKRDRLESGMRMPIRIGLKQQNLDKGAEWLMDVSHPGSSNYGKHWTSDEVISTFSPSNETVSAVRDWLVKSGIPSDKITHSDNKAWLAFDATTKQAENLLHTEYHEYTHTSTGGSVAGCDEYHVPKQIQDHIDYITPGVKGAPLRRRQESNAKKSKRGSRGAPARKKAPIFPANTSQLTTCDQVVTPACIQALYNIKPNDPKAEVCANNSLGIFEEGDFYAQQDLNLFFANFTPYIPNGTHPIPNLIDGAKAPVPLQLAGGESELDFQVAYPLIYPQTTTLYQTDDIYYAFGNDPNATGIFNTFLDAIDGSYCTYSAFGETGNDPVLDPQYPDSHGYNGTLQCGVYEPTNVISISYGQQEQDLPAYYQQRQCNEYMKLGLQGISIFVASGDTGVGGIRGDGSQNGCLGSNATVFSPTQPNSCPWLTNVGGTEISPGKTVHDPESAANDPSRSYSSGGGFSNIFGVPEYQKDAVTKYFAEHDPGYAYYRDGKYNSTGGGVYNRNGRGIPDVAAIGENLGIFVQGEYILEDGTSASAPIFASIINRIVEARLAAGKSRLGFVNPVLYQHPEVLNDVVNGTNPGCGTKGFSAVGGWDPVTGLGTPNYPKMLDLWMGLP